MDIELGMAKQLRLSGIDYGLKAMSVAVPPQKGLFTNDQWILLKKTFKSKISKHLPHLGKTMKITLAKTSNFINSGEYTAAYYHLLSCIPQYSRNEQWIVKVLSHVLNCYIERTHLFQPSSKLAEFDFLAKLSCEVSELMFGQAQEYIRWGETVSRTTATRKLANNGNKSHTIGCKVDGRIVCQVDLPLDLSQIKASKVHVPLTKLFTDKVKLAIETKCILHEIVSRPEYTSASTHFVNNIQLVGIPAQVCTLT